MSIVRAQGKIIGDIEAGVFTKKVDGRFHMLKKPLGWAIDARVFDEEVKNNCHTIVVVDTHADITYSTSVQTFLGHRGVINRGHGRQYFLCLHHWRQCAQSQMKF